MVQQAYFNKLFPMKRVITVILFTLIFFKPTLCISIWGELADYHPQIYKKFVFITCSCNNKNWYESNLGSAFAQDYPRNCFRIIYIDESCDGTADFVAKYVTELNEWDRFTLIRNNSWQSVMHNHYIAGHMCDDEEIIVHLDGDDFLKHDKVLYLLNKAYNKWDIWLTYGQYEDWPIVNLGFSINVPESIAAVNAFRELGFWYSHLRTCYAWLFKSIKLKDLIWKGSFIPTTPTVDYMLMFPMMEMAGDGHYLFIEDVLYLYNRSNSISICNMPIKMEVPPAASWAKYQPLKEKNNTLTNRFKNKKADLVLISPDNPVELEFFLQQKGHIINDISAHIILYKGGCKENIHKYDEIKRAYSDITFINIETDFEQKLIQSLASNHCLIMSDFDYSLEDCSISNIIFELERTGAKIFFLGISKDSFVPCNETINYGPFPGEKIEYRLAYLNDGIAAWQFEYEHYAWQDSKLASLVLLRSGDFLSEAQSLKLNSLQKLLHRLMSSDRDVGLFFEKPIYKKN